MNIRISIDSPTLYWRLNGEILKVEPWGTDGARVRATHLRDFPEIPGALLETLPAQDAEAALSDGKGILTNGKLRVEIWPDGTLHFFHAKTGAKLLEEPEPIFNRPPARWYRPLGSDLSKLEVYFRAQKGERFFGLGQHQHGLLDNKGSVIDLEQRNTEVSIPFYVSSLGYGFLWNNPGVGRVELGTNMTRWVMDATRGSIITLWWVRPPLKSWKSTSMLPDMPRCCRSSPWVSGSANCATAPRKSCWRWCVNTSGVGCHWRWLSQITSTGT